MYLIDKQVFLSATKKSVLLIYYSQSFPKAETNQMYLIDKQVFLSATKKRVVYIYYSQSFPKADTKSIHIINTSRFLSATRKSSGRKPYTIFVKLVFLAIPYQEFITVSNILSGSNIHANRLVSHPSLNEFTVGGRITCS